MQNHVLYLPLVYIAQRLIPSTPPWHFRALGFDNTLYNFGTKSNSSPDLYFSLYMKLVSENCEGYDKIFTDGLKQGICVAAAAVSHDRVLVKWLPNHAYRFSAEAIAILLPLDIVSLLNNTSLSYQILCHGLMLKRKETLRTLWLLKSWNVYTSSYILIGESLLYGFPVT
jgi:hypothetical protein